MIQPKEGEIDYKLAEKNVEKFYNKVLTQDVTEHKVSKKKQSANTSAGELPQKKRISKSEKKKITATSNAGKGGTGAR